MAKQIKLSDETYARVKGAADQNYRTIGGQIEYMMDFIGGKAFVANMSGNLTDGLIKDTPARTTGDVLSDIREVEARKEEELRYCQDDEFAKQIVDRYSEELQPLWDEYNQLKGE